MDPPKCPFCGVVFRLLIPPPPGSPMETADIPRVTVCHVCAALVALPGCRRLTRDEIRAIHASPAHQRAADDRHWRELAQRGYF